jgi:hypothetical protein
VQRACNIAAAAAQGDTHKSVIFGGTKSILIIAMYNAQVYQYIIVEIQAAETQKQGKSKYNLASVKRDCMIVVAVPSMSHSTTMTHLPGSHIEKRPCIRNCMRDSRKRYRSSW